MGIVKLRQGHKAHRVQINLKMEAVEGLGHEVSLLLASGALPHVDNTQAVELLYHMVPYIDVARTSVNVVRSDQAMRGGVILVANAL